MQIVKNIKGKYGEKGQIISFTLDDHVGKVTISKDASPKMLQLLNRCKFQCDVIVKK